MEIFHYIDGVILANVIATVFLGKKYHTIHEVYAPKSQKIYRSTYVLPTTLINYIDMYLDNSYSSYTSWSILPAWKPASNIWGGRVHDRIWRKQAVASRAQGAAVHLNI